MKCNCRNGKVFAHMNYGEYDQRNGWRSVTCPNCGGTGEVPDIQAEWKKQGSKIREWRFGVERMTLTDLKDKCGIGIVALSRAERGVDDPAPVIERLVELGLLPTEEK